MTRQDFMRLIGADRGAAPEYAPVAFLLRSGYAALGYYNAAVNDGFDAAVILLNARLTDLRLAAGRGRPAAATFTEFLEEVAAREDAEDAEDAPRGDEFGRPVPLAVVPLDEVALVYPVSQIRTLVRRAKEHDRPQPQPADSSAAPADSGVPAFFDLKRSEILRVLRMRLW